MILLCSFQYIYDFNLPWFFLYFFFFFFFLKSNFALVGQNSPNLWPTIPLVTRIFLNSLPEYTLKAEPIYIGIIVILLEISMLCKPFTCFDGDSFISWCSFFKRPNFSFNFFRGSIGSSRFFHFDRFIILYEIINLFRSLLPVDPLLLGLLQGVNAFPDFFPSPPP